jgi:hypothetical protein
MPKFSADQIAGKQLVAKRSVPIYDLPTFDPLKKRIDVIRPGQTVGTVFSYVGGKGAKLLNWQFIDKNNKTYYALHDETAFDVKSLQDQGALTTKEETELKADENKGTLEKFLEDLAGGAKNVGKYILIGGAALIALNIILKNRNK